MSSLSSFTSGTLASTDRARPLLFGIILVAVAATGLAALTSAGLAGAIASLVVASGGGLLVAVTSEPARPFGLPNMVTLARLMLAALLAGHLLDQMAGTASEALAWMFAGLAVTGLLLDGVDGWLARRFGPQTAFGARFDMETDAFAILILCALAVATGKAGVWALGIGLMRYGFVAAAAVWPWLAGPLPPSFRRKAVCVLQGAVLAVLMVPPVGPALGAPLAALALAALAWSFGTDIRHLARARLSPAGRDPAP